MTQGGLESALQVLTSNATFLYANHCQFAVKTGASMPSKKMLFLALACALFTTISGAVGQSYPSRPITIVVPFAAGGPTDTLARILAQRMTLSLGQSVIIENVTVQREVLLSHVSFALHRMAIL
jgi:hypothetical protein